MWTISAVANATAEERDVECARGQASILLVGVLCAILVGACVLGAVAKGVALRGEVQRAADLAALAGARAMLDAYPRLFEPATIEGHLNPRHLQHTAYLSIGRQAAEEVARSNGSADTIVTFPDQDTFAPVRIEVRATRRFEIRGEGTELRARAVAELAPITDEGLAVGGGYDGPLAYRQGKPMRPDVARAFDRMTAAARRDGVALIVTSAYRSDAEQAVLWARNPDPRWVAPPGKSLHRNATELDLGPPSAYGWLARNAPRFHFKLRYAWEAWHYGYVLNPRSTPRPTAAAADGDGHAGGYGMPSFVPRRFAAPIARAAQRYNVSAMLLAAQLHSESGFNPFAVSPVGAQGIAQFMPGTARGYGLRNPFDAPSAIDAQARMMRDLLRQFSSVPLALAAYNAGPARVQSCMCIPPIPETRGYVARILGLMGGAGEGTATSTLTVRLVR